MRRRESGTTLIEILIVGLLMTIIGSGLWTLLRSTYDSQYLVVNQNVANTNSRHAVDTLTETLRRASALSAATASSVTATCAEGSIRYWLSGTNIRKQVNGLPTAGTVAISNVTALSFTYSTFIASSPGIGYWSTSAAPGTPANVGAVNFSVTATIKGYTRVMKGSVEIRSKKSI